MRKIKMLFTLMGLSVWILALSVYGFSATANLLYIIAFALSSMAIIFALYCLYQYKFPNDITPNKDYYFYFIDNSPASRDLLYNRFHNRM